MPNAQATLTGRVKWFNDTKGFGFIVSGGIDYFAHFKSIKNKQGRKKLLEGETVQFTPSSSAKGHQAEEIESIDAEGNR